MSTYATSRALAAGGESTFSATRFTAVSLGPLYLLPETVHVVVPSGDGAVGTAGCLAVTYGYVPAAADRWLGLRHALYKDRSVCVLSTDRLDASKLAAGSGRPRRTSRPLNRSEKRAYRAVFTRGLDAVATMPGTTPSTAFRCDTSSAEMAELFLDRLMDRHTRTGTPAVAVVSAGVVRPSWRAANSCRVVEDSALAKTLFPDPSHVGILLEAAQFPGVGAFLHVKPNPDRGSASELLLTHLPQAAPPAPLP